MARAIGVARAVGHGLQHPVWQSGMFLDLSEKMVNVTHICPNFPIFSHIFPISYHIFWSSSLASGKCIICLGLLAPHPKNLGTTPCLGLVNIAHALSKRVYRYYNSGHIWFNPFVVIYNTLSLYQHFLFHTRYGNCCINGWKLTIVNNQFYVLAYCFQSRRTWK